MDSLLKIIKNLKKEEIRNFKIYTNRFQRSDEVKIATLFDLMRSGKYDDDEKKLIKILFPGESENMNAFYRLKNRLKTELEKSLLNLHHNLDERITAINLITLSSIFSYKSEYELSSYYLKKAERIAITNEYYDLLDLIYNQIMSLGHNFNEINPLEYIDKIKANSEKKQVINDANHAIAAISHKLRKANFTKRDEDISQILRRISAEMQIAAEIYNSPRVKFMVYQCVRDILYQNKDFERLEDYLVDTLDTFNYEDLFTKSNHTQKLKLIVWITIVLSINKKWTKNLKYTELLLEELNKYNRLHYDSFIWSYHQSLSTTFMSSNRLDDAISLLEQIIENPTHKGIQFYDYAIHVNLALCFYFNRNVTQAIKSLSHLLTKDIYPKLSTELQLSVSMTEIILHYENNNFDFVSYKIGEIKRQFRGLLKRPEYIEPKSFLKIIFSMANKPDPLNDKQIVSQIKNFVRLASTLQIGSEKHIDYGIWVQSQLNKQPYYAALLETLKEPEA